jgi:hypothetical protein
VQLIERELELTSTLDAVRQGRAYFDSTQVFEALASRAAQEDDEGRAAATLEAAAAWKRPQAGAPTDATASLETVRENFPSLDERTRELLE